MPERSRISPRFFVNQLASTLLEDWWTSYTFVKYQIAKESFNWRHPFGAKHGRGDAVQLVSLRITDMCNLRCHSCGQWGDKRLPAREFTQGIETARGARRNIQTARRSDC